MVLCRPMNYDMLVMREEITVSTLWSYSVFCLLVSYFTELELIFTEIFYNSDVQFVEILRTF